MKILVVGGAGYIGGAVTDFLLRKKIDFTVYDNLTFERNYFKDVDFIFGDIRDKNLLKKILHRFTHVIWLAALVGDGACAIKPDLTRTINYESVKWFSKNYKGRILFTSTCSVYGVNSEPVTEESPTNPISVYAETKLLAESALKKNNALIFRLGTAYGVSDKFSRLRMDLAINYMTMNAIRSKSLTVFGGMQLRPFMHVKDIGRVIVDNLNSDATGIYNLASENSNILDAALRIKKQTGCKIVKVTQKFQDDRSYFADTSKAIRDGVYKKNKLFTIDYGVKEIKDLVLSNRVPDLALENFSNERFLLDKILDYEKFQTYKQK